MRILKREEISPIVLAPGDTISVTYRRDVIGGTRAEQERYGIPPVELVKHTHVGETQVVDEALIFELDYNETSDVGLGLEYGIGGMVGRRST